ncbi:MAG: triose-phosphate isomerase [Bacillota bacterium]
MRTPFICGNWKMNKTVSEAESMVSALKNKVSNVTGVEIGVCPPAVDLTSVQTIIEDTNIKLGGQNLHWEDSGAYTGEVSGPMLSEIGAEYVIVGHSERRQYFGETDQTVNFKVKAAFKHGLKPIICVGETLEERKKEEIEDKVTLQVKAALTGLDDGEVKKVVIAYEPIWAIGTGESATPEEANRVISIIRDVLRKEYGSIADEEIRIQYGGSVKPHNVEELMQQEEIDGALVGGASLEAESFASLVKKTEIL